MKKALGQTVRDIKREVNKKVLKVPSIEQKVLDATSNEPWGPHGSILAAIAQASKNYHEYQMIMSVIWKRINDTGKNWRHVYKALTVLEYLVAHGTERVIDDISEHGYQIATLSDFQYIDSSGRDQGNNVRKKSQSLVVLVNDKERIQEVRQKAASNRDKYRDSSMGSMPPPGSISSSGGFGDKYDDDRYEGRYGNKDDDRNGSVREKDWSSRDNDRNSRYGGSYNEDGDRNGRDSEEHYGRDGYRDGHYGPRSRSVDRYLDRDSVDDGQSSSRGSGAKGDDQSQDGSTTSKSLERKYSEQNLGAPPSYEEVVGATRSPTYSERDGESTIASAPKAASPTDSSPSHTAATSPPATAPPKAQAQAQNSNKEVDGFDEFDPRISSSATPTISNGVAPATSGVVEMDLLGFLSEAFPSNSLALVPANEPTMSLEANAPADFGFGATSVAESSASIIPSQPFDDPFGDGPFKAVPSTTTPQNLYMSSNPYSVQPPSTSPQFMQLDMSTPNQDFDILADILPQSAPSSFVITQTGYPVPADHSVSHTGFPPNKSISQLGPQFVNAPQNGFPIQSTHHADQPSLPTNYHLQSAEFVTQNSFPSQSLALTYPGQSSQSGVHYHSGQGFLQAGDQAPPAQPNPPNSNFYGVYHSQLTTGAPVVSSNPSGPITQPNVLSQSGTAVHVASTGSSAIVPQPSKDKFETKSAIWADTLSRGLVNLNIAGSKTNPTADIGVDFDALNRKDRRMEKPTVAAVTSTITMGKAMGSGSGIGRAGAGVLRPAPNPMVGSGMNFAMAGGPGAGMGDYGANQQMGRGMNMGMGMNGPGNMGMGMNGPGNTGMGMNMPGNMGMGMNGPGNMGIGQGVQQQTGFPPGSTMPRVHNPTMGPGNFGQQPYGGGYRLA